MLIDRTHTPWATASAVILLVAAGAYVPYAAGSAAVSGGTLPGLAYGTIGFAFMAFVTLLALRKKFPIWRIGRTTTWMRGHVTRMPRPSARPSPNSSNNSSRRPPTRPRNSLRG